MPFFFCNFFKNHISASDLPGPVPVTVKTQDGPLLKMADVLFVGEMQDVVKQLVNISQNQGPVTVQDLGKKQLDLCNKNQCQLNIYAN